MIGEEITPFLKKIEMILWKNEIKQTETNTSAPPGYPMDGFRAALKIFSSCFLDKMHELQEADKMELKDREEMAVSAQRELGRVIKTYTGINPATLYDKI